MSDILVHPSSHVSPFFARVVPEVGVPYDVRLDGRPILKPGIRILHVFVHQHALDEVRARLVLESARAEQTAKASGPAQGAAPG